MTIINLDGVVGWEILAEDVNNLIDNTTGDITFDLNSGGGFITEGVSILNKIRSYSRGKTIARVSYAASMMTQIALACDEVHVYDNAIFMIHNAQGFAVGDHREMRKQADMQDRMSGMLAQLYAKKSEKSVDEVRQMMDDDTWLFGEEILNIGFADEVINTDREKDKQASIDMSMGMFKKATKALEEEALPLMQLEKNYKMCVGNCTLSNNSGSTFVPTASISDDTNEINQGAEMQFDRNNLDDTEALFNTLVANKQTMDGRNEKLKIDLQTANAALEAKTEDVEKLTAEHDEKLSEAVANLDSFKAETQTRLDEAISNGVSAEVAMNMVNASSKEDASKLIIDDKETGGATNQASTDPKVGAWDNIKMRGQK